MQTHVRGAALLSAGRTVFDRDGYLGARPADVMAEAECSTGGFYTHVGSTGTPRPPDEKSSPQAAIRAGNLAYLTACKQNVPCRRRTAGLSVR